jgi:hypothetical protein
MFIMSNVEREVTANMNDIAVWLWLWFICEVCTCIFLNLREGTVISNSRTLLLLFTCLVSNPGPLY